MTGQVFSYIRVSSIQQNTDRQYESLGVERGALNVYEEKVSAKDTDRPALTALMDFALRDGDTLRVASLDRLARNLDDLRRLVAELTTKGVRVEFVKESLIFTGEDSAMSKLLLSVMGAFAEFERELIRERQAEGIAVKRASGKPFHSKRRKPKVTAAMLATARQQIESGVPKTKVARDLNISRQTLYTALSA